MNPQKQKPRIGRPPVENPRRIVLSLKVTADEAAAIRRMAAKAKLTVSAFIVQKLTEGK